MSSWPSKLLGEVCEINPRQNGAERLAQSADVSFVPMAAVDESSGTIVGPEKRALGDIVGNYTPFRDGDVLFAKITPCMENGKAAIARGLANGCGFGSTEFHVLRCRDVVIPEWIFAFVRQLWFREVAKANFTGTAGQQRVPIDFLRTVSIPVPPLPEQKRIVRILDEADALRRLRAQANEQTHAVEAALFQELFGSPAANPFGWAIVSVGELFDQSRGGVKCGPFGSALKRGEYTDTGVPVWGIPNVLPNQFVEAGSLFIPREKFLQLRPYAVEPGDLLISRAGTVGRVCVARPHANESIIGTNLIRLTLDKARVLPDFFAALLTHFVAEVGRLRADTNETSYSFMNTTVLKSLRIYLPPIELQEQFVAGIADVRKMQDAQATSRQRLDDLFQCVLHRAFQGEL